MRNYIAKILMDKAGDPPAGGEPAKAPMPPPPGQSPAQPPAAAQPAKVEEDGPETDELGYPIAKAPKAGDPPKAGDSKPKDPPAESKEVEKPVTGYGKEPPKVEEAPKAPEPPKEPPTELDKKLEGLHKSFIEEAKKDVADLGLEGDKLDKYVAKLKQKQADALAFGERQEKEQQANVQRQRASWHKEFQEDPVFGGDKFLTNVARGEKVVEEFGPELKKELTAAGIMLRPSVMKLLSRVADRVYPDEKMVQGDPPVKEKTEDEKSDDPLAFYE